MKIAKGSCTTTPFKLKKRESSCEKDTRHRNSPDVRCGDDFFYSTFDWDYCAGGLQGGGFLVIPTFNTLPAKLNERVSEAK